MAVRVVRLENDYIAEKSLPCVCSIFSGLMKSSNTLPNLGVSRDEFVVCDPTSKGLSQTSRLFRDANSNRLGRWSLAYESPDHLIIFAVGGRAQAETAVPGGNVEVERLSGHGTKLPYPLRPSLDQE